MSIRQGLEGYFSLFFIAIALGAFIGGAALAWHHPLWPMMVLAIFYTWCIAVAWRPGIWLFVVPASLPWLNFSPWTGWLIFDEFDILLLGTLAGGYCRLAWERWAPITTQPTAGFGAQPYVLPGLLLAVSAVALVRGTSAVGGLGSGAWVSWLSQGYLDPMNSVRVFKSIVWAVLCLPLLLREMRSPVLRERASRYLGYGMVVALTCVTLVVVWERIAFPGFFNFSTHYRTTALFWEMHVGGAAIDGFIAMATPFVAWALWQANRPSCWLPFATLALLTCYAALTTFSRGVYLAVALPLTILGLRAWAQKSGFDFQKYFWSVWRWLRPEGWRTKAGLALAIALLFEIVGVWGGGTYMQDRLARSDLDFADRIAHWQRGLGLLHSPMDWILGIGLGRLPAAYAGLSTETEVPGAVHLTPVPTNKSGGSSNFITIFGPATNPDLRGLYGLTQRVNWLAAGPYRVSVRVRVPVETGVLVRVCEKHLLYDGHCFSRYVKVNPVAEGWQTLKLVLQSGGSTEWFGDAPGYAPRFGVFSMSVLATGGSADVADVQLDTYNNKPLLANGDFTLGLTHWFPAAQGYYLPWHIDNLFLEVLIERGVVGLGAFGLLFGCVLLSCPRAMGQGRALVPYVLAAVSGGLLVGLVSSVMDVPRVAFLLYLLSFFATCLACKPADVYHTPLRKRSTA